MKGFKSKEVLRIRIMQEKGIAATGRAVFICESKCMQERRGGCNDESSRSSQQSKASKDEVGGRGSVAVNVSLLTLLWHSFRTGHRGPFHCSCLCLHCFVADSLLLNLSPGASLQCDGLAGILIHERQIRTPSNRAPPALKTHPIIESNSIHFGGMN